MSDASSFVWALLCHEGISANLKQTSMTVYNWVYGGWFSKPLAELPLGLGQICVLIPSDSSGCITTSCVSNSQCTHSHPGICQQHPSPQVSGTNPSPQAARRHWCTIWLHTLLTLGVHELVNTQDVWTWLDTVTCASTSCVITTRSVSPWPLIPTDVYQCMCVNVCLIWEYFGLCLVTVTNEACS